MYYILPLGNPGAQYDGTRHNFGMVVADAFVKKAHLDAPRTSARYHGRLTEGRVERELVTVLYPGTYMNNSGEAAAALVPKDRVGRLVVLHDEVALPLGKIRISKGSGAAGHNGVASVIAALGTTEFIRVRLGVGAPPPTLPLEHYVLGRFTEDERAMVATMTLRGVEAVQLILHEGIEAAMTAVNR
ncbi:aminoacyl-tRNA hydrolase [Patescibacteria group bacterium]|nr:aminoacyl-tRNA hydrolase [Patescibacteria group bacterium]